MGKPTLSVICIYNNIDLFENSFLPSLKAQQMRDYVLIARCTAQEKRRSITPLLNDAVGAASSDYLLFVHQDIVFEAPDTLNKILDYCTKSSDRFAMWGVAGAAARKGSPGQYEVRSIIVNGPDKVSGFVNIDDATPCQCVDECCFIMRRDTALKHPFLELNSWHFYAVSECLQLSRAGLASAAIPVRVWHMSYGRKDGSYYLALDRLCREFRADFPLIYTTCGAWNTSRRYFPRGVLVSVWFWAQDHATQAQKDWFARLRRRLNWRWLWRL